MHRVVRCATGAGRRHLLYTPVQQLLITSQREHDRVKENNAKMESLAKETMQILAVKDVPTLHELYPDMKKVQEITSEQEMVKFVVAKVKQHAKAVRASFEKVQKAKEEAERIETRLRDALNDSKHKGGKKTGMHLFLVHLESIGVKWSDAAEMEEIATHYVARIQNNTVMKRQYQVQLNIAEVERNYTLRVSEREAKDTMLQDIHQATMAHINQAVNKQLQVTPAIS